MIFVDDANGILYITYHLAKFMWLYNELITHLRISQINEIIDQNQNTLNESHCCEAFT
jgi:hypothetical protein